MKFAIKKSYHNDINVLNINKLPNRSYFIPFENRVQADSCDALRERYSSSRVFVFDDGWTFKYYKSINDVPDIFDSEAVDMPAVKVPSTWQRSGYENPWYLNTRYQFRMRPPYIDSDVPVGIYHNDFVLTGEGDRSIITFLGVCSNISLYVNGNFAGYAEGSHDMNEFDITDYVTQGNNELLVMVTKFCNGSYLECQDMFRENGIFRDVYITEASICDIYDFSAETDKNKDGTYNLNVAVNISNPTDGCYINAELIDAKGNSVSSAMVEYGVSGIKFTDLQVKEWSAEIPYLYSLYITLVRNNTPVTCIKQLLGFKTVEIRGETFLFNGQPVKLLGVNHHDTDPENGWVMSPEQLERDVKLMKEYNCNAVRMSHYPPDPLLLTLCDIYGLYVVDEADIECHNVYSNPLNQRFGRISNNPLWKNHFIERVDNMYKRDRNHACIVMWSLGNEAGGYKCHDDAYHHLKQYTSVPIHYEGVIHTKRHSYDVISQMYPSLARVKAVAEKKLDVRYEGKPYFLCEYAHAMGVGPGALEDYADLFYSYANLMGGCIWEFADHAVLHKEGKYKYTYGGDHNEPKHDGNFCVDGLFRPDRTPGSGALNMKAVYRPVRVERINNSVFRFKNMLYFKNADYIECKWQLMRNGIEAEKGNITLNIAPQCVKDIDLGYSPTGTDADYYVVFTYIDKKTGSEIAKEQCIVNETQYDPMLIAGNSLTMTVSKKVYTIRYDCGSIIYDANKGELVSYTVNNAELINQDPSSGIKGLDPGIYRAEIDNDRFIKIAWNMLGYNRSQAVFKSAKVQENNGTIDINSKYVIKGLGGIADCKLNYSIASNGAVRVTVRMSKKAKMLFYSDIPRCGVAMELPREFDNVEYYGMGDVENVGDMKEHTVLGIYGSKVSDMEEFYIKPQDNGNRTGVRYVKITRNDGKGLEIIHRGDYLNMRVKHYALKDIVGAGHTEDVTEKDTTVLYIDGYYRGAGSQSCGQKPVEEFRPNLKKPLEFTFIMKPVKE